MSMLYVINGPEKGREFPLHEETATVGRAPGNTVQLKDRSISRNHLKITRTEGKYCITDLGTTNGTFISGKRIPPNKPFEVDAGQPIAIGNVFFSLASPYEGDDRSVQELIDLAGRLSDGDMAPIQDRPMTLKKNMELVSKVSRALSGSSDIRDILEKTLSYIFELLDRIDRGVIILTDPETGKILDVIPRFKTGSDDTITMYSRTVVDQVLREGRPVSVADTIKERQLSDSMVIMKIRSVLCVPMISRSQIRGVIYIDSVNRPHGFRSDDVDLISALSSPAAVAIENAMLLSNLDKTQDSLPGAPSGQ